MTPRTWSNGYSHVRLTAYGKRRGVMVHHLVAYAFLGPRPLAMDIRHLDGNRLNCALENLAYGTRSENIRDEVKHGTHFNGAKKDCPAGHEYVPSNTYFRANGHRRCRKCVLARNAGRPVTV